MCENVLLVYSRCRTPTTDPGISAQEAWIYADAAALEAVDILTERRGSRNHRPQREADGQI